MKTAIIGSRGMVGSVLLQRMKEEGDFNVIEPVFCSTSQVGSVAAVLPINGKEREFLFEDAHDLEQLRNCDCIISCQGGDYTQKVYTALKEQHNWKGYWIDAASTLRMKDDAIIVLDPVNSEAIHEGLKRGVKTFVGGNCTVSLMLLALQGLFKEDLVAWLSSMTYQSASGAGAQNIKELIAQSAYATKGITEVDQHQKSSLSSLSAVEAEKLLNKKLHSSELPTEAFGFPLAFNVLPFIDKEVSDGQSREEWKGEVETNKILGTKTKIPVDGICVRVPSLRCHSQAFTIKLKKNLPLDEIESLIAKANDWVKVIPNTKIDSLSMLTPAAVSGTLNIHIGRIRKMRLGEEYLTAFTVGDQLLWGAAEPLRRVLRIVVGR
jgi:aspartate-semialdehyde dehydrogenase